MTTTELNPPGRLGDSSMTLETDPRTNPSLLKLLKSINMSGHLEDPFPAADTPASVLEPLIATFDEGVQQLYDSLPNDLPSDKHEPTLERKTITIDGVDGNKIALHMFLPPAPASETPSPEGAACAAPVPVPAIVYLHGGGMTINRALNKVHERWCTSLALGGVIVVLVDFRNAWAEGGVHSPFPAGLNDCVSATRYVHENRRRLGVSKIVLQGESGGANLSLAVALKAKREGWIGEIAGVSAQAPYISGAYGWERERKERELPGLVECDGYLLSSGGLAAMVSYYSPQDRENPLAWPYFAKEEELKGLPPHHITVAELDPLKSEGLAYYRRLLAAGVRATASVQVGVVHAAYLFFRQALPAEHDREARDIVAFAKSL